VPTQPYYNAVGKRLPGVTTVIGSNCGWNKDALMGWANREGLAGRSIRGEGGQRSVSERAADIGTAAHSMIEAAINGQKPEKVAAKLLADLGKKDADRARQGFVNFQRWYRQTGITIIGTEVVVIDEGYQTGGCLDAIGIEKVGKTIELSVVDWKSSKGTYVDHFVQIAAYTVFLERFLKRWFKKEVRCSGAHVVRVSKFDGVFNHKFWSRDDLEGGWAAFTWMRKLHEVRWNLEAFVK
jgi:hypothetical protein